MSRKVSDVHLHHTEEHFTSGDLVRDLVIGMSDGLTVPFALAAGVFVHNRVEQRGGEPHGVEAVAPNRRRQIARRRHPFRIEDTPPAVQQRGPHLEGGGVEGRRREVRNYDLAAERDVGPTEQQPEHAAVRHFDAFRRAGGTRCIDDIRKRVGSRAIHRVLGTLTRNLRP